MNFRLFYLMFFLLNFLIKAQNYRIANWWNNFPSATVISYDDWSPGQATHAVNEHLRTKIPGTFYVTTGNAWRSEDYLNMQKLIDTSAVEIGNHTITHPNLTQVNTVNLENEINGTKTFLENNLINEKVLTLAYPLGAYNNNVIQKTMENHIAGRGISLPNSGLFSYNFALNELDYYNIPTVTVNNSLSANDFNDWINHGILNGGLLTFMVHSISGEGIFDNWWDEIDIEYYRELMNILKNRNNETWITTIREAIKYHKEKNSAQLDIISQNNVKITLTLSDTLSNNSIYNQPLTIFYAIENPSKVLSIKQNNQNISFKTKQDSLVFDAIPDGGNIEIELDFNVFTNSINYNNVQIYPNPFKNIIYLKNNSTNINNYNGYITDLSGKIIFTFNNVNQLNLTDLNHGSYIINLNNNQYIHKQIIIKQ